jgi:hypothetical protein
MTERPENLPDRTDLDRPDDPFGPHVRALRESLRSSVITVTDAAAVQLAYHYARLADAALQVGTAGAAIMIKLGPPYLQTLQSLGLTPAARSALLRGAKDVGPDHRSSPLDQLKQQRQKRNAT